MEGMAVLYAVVAVLSLISLAVAWHVIRLLKSRNENLYAIIESQNEAIDKLLATMTNEW